MLLKLISGDTIKVESVRLANEALIRLSEELARKFDADTFSFIGFGGPLDLIANEVGNRFAAGMMGDDEKRAQIAHVIRDVSVTEKWIDSQFTTGASVDELRAVEPPGIDLSQLYPPKKAFLSKRSFFRGLSYYDEQRAFKILQDESGCWYRASPYSDNIEIVSDGRKIKLVKSSILWMESGE